MAKHIKLLKNTFNKSQYRKWDLVNQAIGWLKEESYPNGNSGYCDSQVMRLFQIHSAVPGLLNNVVTKNVWGDAHTCGSLTIDPSLLSKEDEDLLSSLMTKVQHGKYQLPKLKFILAGMPIPTETA